ncbi:hypothetical protein SAMN05877842_101327 [Ureibacillus acetophenoni]|uniref:Uncharacterized protein n=1 Tax=Ureibacillus acetophenoni TaxID=614649 RepID=A0A285U081_9BACL|nr:hypothetical protein SAMN05877842_101327 [Ureibacillus acetophenoni]
MQLKSLGELGNRLLYTIMFSAIVIIVLVITLAD